MARPELVPFLYAYAQLMDGDEPTYESEFVDALLGGNYDEARTIVEASEDKDAWDPREPGEVEGYVADELEGLIPEFDEALKEYRAQRGAIASRTSRRRIRASRKQSNDGIKKHGPAAEAARRKKS